MRNGKGTICLECRHCTVDAGSCGYGEYTPSTPFVFECRKGKDLGVDIPNHEGGKESMLKGIQQAETCEMFEREVTR